MANTSEAQPQPGSPLNDFPEFLGPMVVKELRQGVRGKMFVVPFVAIHVAMLLALGFDFSISGVIGGRGGASMGYGIWNLFSGLPSQAAFWLVALLMMLVVMPWAGLGSLSREREGRNGELLLMAGVSRWKIVMGKWITLCALGLLTATTMLPYLFVRYFIGAMNVPGTLMMLFVAILLNATANAMAIGLSGYASIGMRLVIGALGIVAFYFSVMIVSASTAYLFGKFVPGETVGAVIGALLGATCACLLYASLGLQLARLRMRPYERPYEDATSGGVCALIILSPMMLGLIAALTFGMAALIGAALLAYAVIKMDPSPKERRRLNAAPPYNPVGDAF